MYQDYFQFQAMPFNLTPNTNFFCKLKGHQDAFNALHFCINTGEGFLKVIGEVGSGKTLLSRKLIDSLDDRFVTAYIPGPDLTPIELRRAVAREFGLQPAKFEDQHELITAIYQHLMDLHVEGKRPILLIDEGQALTDEGLETIRLLTNLETQNIKLMQVVLFGQPELEARLNKPHLRQLRQRITFSYYLPLLSRDELDSYLYHRLAIAGNNHGQLFTKRARNLLYKASQGVPRIVNILSHKSLLLAYSMGVKEVDHKTVGLAVKDTYYLRTKDWKFYLIATSALFSTILIVGLLIDTIRNI